MPRLKKLNRSKAPRQQRGAVLIVGLIMLLVMTLLSVSSMSGSILEERMAANSKDRQVAFQAAEIALRQGERLTASNTVKTAYTTACTNGLCLADIEDGFVYPEYWLDSTTWSNANKHITYAITGITSPAKLIIEYMGRRAADPAGGAQVTDPTIFRITALGYGQSANSQVMLQSTFILP